MLQAPIIWRHPLVALYQQLRVCQAAVEVAEGHVAYCNVPLYKAERGHVAEGTKGCLAHPPHKVPALACCVTPEEPRVNNTIYGLHESSQKPQQQQCAVATVGLTAT